MDRESSMCCVCVQVHVVTAFEKSLMNMTQRLQKLAAASEQKVYDNIRHTTTYRDHDQPASPRCHLLAIHTVDCQL